MNRGQPGIKSARLYSTPPDPCGLQQQLIGNVNQIYVQAAGADMVRSAVDPITTQIIVSGKVALVQIAL